MAILDQPIEILKKPMGQSVDFDMVMDKILRHKTKKEKK